MDFIEIEKQKIDNYKINWFKGFEQAFKDVPHDRALELAIIFDHIQRNSVDFDNIDLLWYFAKTVFGNWRLLDLISFQASRSWNKEDVFYYDNNNNLHKIETTIENKELKTKWHKGAEKDLIKCFGIEPLHELKIITSQEIQLELTNIILNYIMDNLCETKINNMQKLFDNKEIDWIITSNSTLDKIENINFEKDYFIMDLVLPRLGNKGSKDIYVDRWMSTNKILCGKYNYGVIFSPYNIQMSDWSPKTDLDFENLSYSYKLEIEYGLAKTPDFRDKYWLYEITL